MTITLIYIGRQKKNIYEEVEQTFVKRIKHYVSLKIKAIQPISYPRSLPIDNIRKKEEELIANHLSSSSINILLDENGKVYDSKQFSQFLNSKLNLSKDINFIVGGAYGFSKSAKAKADCVLSLSKLTMPHHMARVVFLEQLYRAYTIMRNEKYHKN